MLSSRKKKSSRRKNPRGFLDRPISYFLEAVVVLGVLSGTGYAFYGYVQESDYFRVKSIQVLGAELLSVDDIAQCTGITSEDNLFFLDESAVESKVAAMPYVKTCRVTCSFPDQVVLTIEERRPTAYLLVENRTFALDREGVVLEELRPDVAPDGPFISNVPGLTFVEVGRQLPQPEVRAALEAWAAFSESAMGKDVLVSEVSAPDENAISMYCFDVEPEIRWGRGQFKERARNLDILWEKMDKKLPGKEYVDLRFDDEVVVK